MYKTQNGGYETRIEELYTPQRRWGLGCKLCRIAKLNNAYARGEVSGVNAVRLQKLQRHGGNFGIADGQDACHSRGHMRAQQQLLQHKQEVATVDNDRLDVPSRGLYATAYKCAKAGASFQSYEIDVRTSRD